jgi:hypothetical protein
MTDLFDRDPCEGGNGEGRHRGEQAEGAFQADPPIDALGGTAVRRAWMRITGGDRPGERTGPPSGPCALAALPGSEWGADRRPPRLPPPPGDALDLRTPRPRPWCAPRCHEPTVRPPAGSPLTVCTTDARRVTPWCGPRRVRRAAGAGPGPRPGLLIATSVGPCGHEPGPMVSASSRYAALPATFRSKWDLRPALLLALTREKDQLVHLRLVGRRR